MNAEQKVLVLETVLSRKGAFDAVDIAIAIGRRHDVRIDWHPISAYLDYLSRTDRLQYVEHGSARMIRYRVGQS